MVMVMVMDGHSPSILLVALLCIAWLNQVVAMRPDRMAQLRQDTVEMFYHGYSNYMDLAFPEDEVRRDCHCTPHVHVSLLLVR